MSVLDFPAGFRRPSGVTFSLVPSTRVFQSPLNGAMQTVELPGARWEASISWADLRDAEIRILRAWLARLRGMSGRFRLWDMSHEAPAGTGNGTPVVAGAGQTGGSLLTSGWAVSETVLKAGDYIGVNGELKILTLDAASDAGGLATLQIEPPLRASPANGAALTLAAPTCTMRLKDDGQDRFAIRPPFYADCVLECVEAFS